MDLVSIITPMYNAERYVEDTIKSVLNQTYKNWEMIIVDDCSNDNSPEIVKKYADIDERIVYIKVDSNKGVSHARNIALKTAKGRYIAFLDSDDIWKEEKLNEQINFMNETGAVICFTSYELIDENSNALNKIIKAPQMTQYKKLLKGNVIGSLTVLIDKEKLDFEIKLEGVPHEDYVLWLAILKRGYNAYGIDKSLAYYRKSSKSLSGNKIKAAKWTWNIYRNIEKIPLHKAIYYFVNYAINGIKKS
ncbi:MAG: glycosyltransferase [Clostridioides sp.]|jgi:glycosyltransferase involved in cell wall biosynthesis|nr:glycosyltransferase [Clostridioides sp.]